MGCNGGLMDNAFRYLEEYRLEIEANYPYTAKDGSCNYDILKGAVKVKEYTDVPSTDAQMQAALSKQPIAIAVDATCFMSYSSGVLLPDECTTQLNHGVLAVGYA